MAWQQERAQTEARLASALELKVIIPVIINIGNSFAIDWSQGITLGTISRMVRTQTRDIRRRYTLGRYAFEPYDLIPGKITTKLKLEKVVLYSEYMVNTSLGSVLNQIPLIGGTAAGLVQGASNLVGGLLGVEPLNINQTQKMHLSDGDLLGALGFVSGNLFYQQVPFAIQEIVHPPEVFSGLRR